MPLRRTRHDLRLEGTCSVEDALALLKYLMRPKPPTVDLRSCTHLHTALAQVLMACRPPNILPPDDPFLAQWLMPLLRPSAEAG